MQTELEVLSLQVLKKISPTPEDYVKVETLSKRLVQKVFEACQQQNINASVRVEGSIAKDTWLKENPDIDLFIRLPTVISREKLGEVGLAIARSAVMQEASKIVERYAEHPYLEIVVNGQRVDIVPCYDVKPGKWQSATDRTPYHTNYIKQHLCSSKMQGEVRLLKQFMQNIGVYGAEIKIGGFSGYLCELLILTYSSFIQTLQVFANYNKRLIIDIERHYIDRKGEGGVLFGEPLVIVDPVDKYRNVASAVQLEKLYMFIAASRAFLQTPLEAFFFAPKQCSLAVNELKCQLDSYMSTLLFLVVEGIEAVPDVLWGQLYKSKRVLHKFLEFNCYKVLRDAVWSNEKSLNVFIFELEQQCIANIKKHFGPPLERQDECNNFLVKYAKNDQVIAGPYIEEGKWIVEITRKNTDAVILLKENLALTGGKNVGVPELLAKAFKENFSVLVNKEITQICNDDNKEFMVFLTTFLSGKPFWLK
ncbi:MAG: CCA tRNA nucleotidyltransferase [Candidatus Bathyarchaeota archaeon]|uniref:CCA tRNA nucleotidyltransferase n=1 Tax=Candidatus Bathycorpusculum sp. TaxID=2994959 RepID=UPI00282A8A38|nr:CCA tRNA nucleotidyltransferase [Candidatus Termiticorpusculum sp.]MCL2258076.1 CCA tRNA nucleotidyltransferase [Candidatus Termiticorpusculum sp.]MCL2291682.1 CCA tRNA nucleotidyltransferase [Candidatus Termiticorpusculum sp.]